jgi:hypothetical protein
MVLLISGERLILESKTKETSQYNSSGKLTLTNFKLTFEKIEGLISKKSSIVFEVPLSSIKNVGVEGLITKKLTVQVSWGGRLEKCLFSVDNAKDWDAAIRSAIQQSV